MQQARHVVGTRSGHTRRLLRTALVLVLALPAVLPLAAALARSAGPAAAGGPAAAAGAAAVLSTGAAAAPGSLPTPTTVPARTAPPQAARAGTRTPLVAPAVPAPAARRSGSLAAGEAAQVKVQRVVGLGDSVPAGSSCGCSDYVSLLARRLGDDVTSTNLAVPGETSSDLVDQLSSGDVRAALADADVVVVTIGANDVEVEDPQDCDSSDPVDCYADALAALRANLEKIADRVTALLARPGARVLLTGYWNAFLDGDVGRAKGSDYVRVADAVTAAVNDRVRSVAAAHGAQFVDLFTPFRGPDGSKDCTPLLASDGDHPNAAGHALIARTLAAAL